MTTNGQLTEASPLKRIAKAVGFLAIAGTIVPPTLNMFGWVAAGPMQHVMLASAIAWFVAAPFWMDVD